MVLGDVQWCTEKLLFHCLLCLCIYTPLLGLHFVSLPLQAAEVTGDCWTGGLKIKPIWTQSLNVPIIIFQLTLFLPTASRGQNYRTTFLYTQLFFTTTLNAKHEDAVTVLLSQGAFSGMSNSTKTATTKKRWTCPIGPSGFVVVFLHM